MNCERHLSRSSHPFLAIVPSRLSRVLLVKDSDCENGMCVKVSTVRYVQRAVLLVSQRLAYISERLKRRNCSYPGC